MNMFKKLQLIFLCGWALSAFSAGFSILEQSPAGLGRSLAGMTAETTDPSALYFNPSATAWFDHPSLVAGNHILTGNCRFHDRHSTMDGADSEDFVGTSFIPNLAYVHPLDAVWTLNFTMSATSGTETNYPWDWMGRYFARTTSVAVLEMQPSVSYRVAENLSIALGVMIQYAKMEMKQSLDRPADYLPVNDTRMRLSGDSWAFGITAGMTWKALEHTAIGLGYRSPMRHKFNGDVSFQQGYAAVYDTVLGDKGTMVLTMPQCINLGVVQEMTERWRLMLDISWTDWSIMKEMEVKFTRGASYRKSTENMRWHDSWRFAIGTDYKISDKWTIRCGAAFDERTVTKADTKTFKLPDSNRYWLSIGASYQYSERLRLDASFTHLFFQSSKICQTHSDGRCVDGEACGYSNLVSLGLKYDF